MKLKYKYRLSFLIVLFLSVFVLIWVQLFKLQISNSNELITEAKKHFFKPTFQLRGDIRDRNSNLLAIDTIEYDLYNNVKDIKKLPTDKIKNLAHLLNTSYDQLVQKLSQQKNTKMFSSLNEETATTVQKNYFDIAYPVPKAKRAYPYKSTASHIIGFVNNDRKGQHGIELFYNNLITKPAEYSNKNNLYPKGTDIVLTIDTALQEFAEEKLESTIKTSKAEKGTVIVLSPKTGEIYAWSVYPKYNPNTFYKEKAIKNWAITDIYEPGSTFKVISIASALENNVITEDSKFYDEGKLEVGKRIIRNHHKTEPQYINLLELFKQSSNVVSSKIALLMEPKDFYNSIKNFMIGQKTGIDLPGESIGLLKDYKKWREIDRATTSFGQGSVSVTPIQLASAISVIANKGIWVQPHVLKGIWDNQYNLITKSPHEIKTKQVVSEDTANLVSMLLRQSVKENIEAKDYIGGNIPGYEVAGKTGTAQKIRPDGRGYLPGQTVASFIGYFPADNPEILILAVVDDPKTAGRWGNTICGPIFNSVAQFAAKRILNSKEQLATEEKNEKKS